MEVCANRRFLPGGQPLARVSPHTAHIVMEPEVDCETEVANVYALGRERNP